MKKLNALLSLLLVLALCLGLGTAAFAIKADFEYTLILTDQDGREVYNPRDLAVGDTLNIEIELKCTDTNEATYETYGLEFRLMSRGLQYNGDGASFRSGTPVRLLQYDSGDSVGFAYYDMEQVGETVANPMLAGRWSYTVTDPGSINITVPVALLYIVEDKQKVEPVGNARLFLDPAGGEILGEDISGEYRSGTQIILPEAELNDREFLGWSDGAEVYPAGSGYTVTGIVTLTAKYQEPERSRQVVLNPEGGDLVDTDAGGMYADGDKIILPGVTREGYAFDGWLVEGKLYQPGDEYTVHNSVVFIAQWTKLDLIEFDPEGGNIKGGDPSGAYREGTVIRLPGAEREGYVFGGWSDGEHSYQAGDEYTVSSDRDLTAVWEPAATPTPAVEVTPTPEPTPGPRGPEEEEPERVIWPYIAGGVAALGLLVWWLILLGKRRWVLYSLKTGDVALSYKDKEHDAQVEAVLYDEDKEYHLNKSGQVLMKHKLRFMKGSPVYPIVEVKPGKYKGKLIITDGAFTKEVARRVKVLDREIRERENK